MIPFRGRKGQNDATFAGRVGGRPLEPGVYLLTISPKRRVVANAPTEYVRVASPRRTVPLADGARKPTCTATQARAADPAFRFLTREPRKSLSLPSVRPFLPTVPLRPPLTPREPGASDGDEGFALPSPAEIGGAARDGLGETLVTVGVLVVINILLLAMLALAARFLRGSWSP